MSSALPVSDSPNEEQIEREKRLRLLGYPSPGWHFSPFTPAIWVAMVWLAMVTMLIAVGYLDPDIEQDGRLAKLTGLFNESEADYAARRAALALSGVTLAITVVLSITGCVWAASAFTKKLDAFRRPALVLSVVFLIVCLLLSWGVTERFQPFSTTIGQQLLDPKNSGVTSKFAYWVPYGMFVLACVVPCVLLAGATFLLQPMCEPKHVNDAPAKTLIVKRDQLNMLIGRVRELDQMLYIGAITLVFGTLQLSAGLSVPLASMPKAATVKLQAELCKVIATTAGASAVFSAAPAASAVDATCQEIPKHFVQLESADSLRQLVHGITVCFGLAFTALLAAVYVPALVGLRLMIEMRLPDVGTKPSDEADKTIAEIDPLRRVAAIVATLSPLFAGLVANSLAIG